MLNFNLTKWNEISESKRVDILQRPVSKLNRNMSDSVKDILKDVKTGGDEALLKYTSKFDGVTLDSVEVSKSEIADAEVSDEIKRALEVAASRIRKFHSEGLSADINLQMPCGATLKKLVKPIERVGLYIPGGSAPLVSTVLMLGIPALIAGSKLKVLVTPPNKNGEIDPSILVAARMCEIDKIYKAGGAQAIAAMAYGTETIPKVDKIFGPGNAWVTEAKTQVALDPNGATCDMPAGPSEVLLIADETANPSFVTSDLMSQAEHGGDSQVVLISNSERVIREVMINTLRVLEDFPRREIATESLKFARFILCENIETAFTISNQYAPEHLIVQVEKYDNYIDLIKNAGSVFLGNYTPESLGDYASGTNHVLPTYGYAKSISGLSVDAFQKKITFQEFSKESILQVGPVVETLASIEGLEGHKRAVTVRLEEIKREQND